MAHIHPFPAPIRILLLLGILIGIGAAVYPHALHASPLANGGPSLTGGTYFVHVASADNISEHTTRVRHPLLDGDPDVIFFVTPHWSPNGIKGVYYKAPYGVYYNATTKAWYIFSQDFSPMPPGAAFNIYIPDSTITSFVHTASASNTEGPATALNSPLLNDNVNALVLVTQRWNPNNVYNPHHIGVTYDAKWVIFNQDAVNIPTGASFNVAIITPMSRAFAHLTHSSNVQGHISWIDHPLVNGNPDAVLMATQGAFAVPNNHGIGVWYNAARARWSVFNQDTAAMPENVPFHMLAAPPYTAAFSAREPSPASNYVQLDHPYLNSNIGALVFTTVRGSVTNAHPKGVFFKVSLPLARQGASWATWIPGSWAVYNEDLALMPKNIGFNVFMPPPSLRAFVHRTTGDNIDKHRTILDHPMLNNNPDALVFVEHSWNPDGEVTGTYHNHYTGVFYDEGLQRWVIFNQDNADMANDRFFNVFVANGLPNAFVHQVTKGNGDGGGITYLDSPLTNNNPAALILVTPRYGYWTNFALGVWYHPTLERWAIVAQDGSDFSVLHRFNVLVFTNRTYLPFVVND